MNKKECEREMQRVYLSAYREGNISRAYVELRYAIEEIAYQGVSVEDITRKIKEILKEKYGAGYIE